MQLCRGPPVLRIIQLVQLCRGPPVLRIIQLVQLCRGTPVLRIIQLVQLCRGPPVLRIIQLVQLCRGTPVHRMTLFAISQVPVFYLPGQCNIISSSVKSLRKLGVKKFSFISACTLFPNYLLLKNSFFVFHL